MTSADDWTRELSTKGFPELQKLYALLGKPDNVMLKRAENFKHNFNYVSRAGMYSWINLHFNLGHADPIEEPDYRRLSEAEMTVWDAAHPKPAVADPAFERNLLEWFSKDAAEQIGAREQSFEAFQKAVGPAVDFVLGRNWEETGAVEWKLSGKVDKGAWVQKSGLVSNKTYGEQLPVIQLEPKKATGHAVLWLSEDGKAGLFDAAGALNPRIQRLVDAGTRIIGVDLLYQGDFLNAGKLERTPVVKNPRESAAYTFGYNPSVFAQRVHDILTITGYFNSPAEHIDLLDAVALDGTGPLLAAARSQCGGEIRRAAIDTRGFRFGRVLDLRSPDFLPGGAKYGDLPGMLALGNPHATWLAGETPETVRTACSFYEQSGSRLKLAFSPSNAEPSGVVEWLLAGPVTGKSSGRSE
jgi:hypothetical protein